MGITFFGGHVIAQALLAAYETVEGRVCHSLHAYFIRPGNVHIPVVFEVDRARDGGSFTTRRVIAIQNGEQIFNLAASFQIAREGLEHQFPMPPAPTAESLDEEPSWRGSPRPIDIRWPSPRRANDTAKYPPQERKSGCAPRTPSVRTGVHLQQAMLAYASDMAFMETALQGARDRLAHAGAAVREPRSRHVVPPAVRLQRLDAVRSGQPLDLAGARAGAGRDVYRKAGCWRRRWRRNV